MFDYNSRFVAVRLIAAQLLNPRYRETPGALVDFNGPWHRPLLYKDLTFAMFAVCSVGVADAFPATLQHHEISAEILRRTGERPTSIQVKSAMREIRGKFRKLLSARERRAA